MSRLEMPPFQNVPGASTPGKAIIPSIPMGYVYNGFQLKLPAGTVASDISLLEFKLGGKPIWSLTGAFLNYINQHDGLNVSASYLNMHFADRTGLTYGGQRLGALDLKNKQYSNASLEVTLDGTQTGTTLELIAHTGEDKPKIANLDSGLMFRSLIQQTFTPASGATHDLAISVGSDGANVLRKLHMSHTNLTHFGIQKDGVPVADLLALADHDNWQDEVLRNNQSGYFTFDFIPDGNQLNAFSVMNGNIPAAMRWRATTSGSDTIVCVPDILARNIATV